MAGSPKKRAKRERAAKKRLEILAQQQADERARNIRRKPRYGPKLAEEIASLIATGIPIEDSVLNGTVISPGVATRLLIGSRTIWDWQKQHAEFAQAITRARDESAHRISDRMLALADAALKEPSMANAVRVAADILKWQAQVRNPGSYGELRKVQATVEVPEKPQVPAIEIVRKLLFVAKEEAMKAPIEDFIKSQVTCLHHVADYVAYRGGGSTTPGHYPGKFEDVVLAIAQAADFLKSRLQGEIPAPATTSPRLPAPAPQSIAGARAVDPIRDTYASGDADFEVIE